MEADDEKPKSGLLAQEQQPVSRMLRLTLASLVTWNLFCNHWSRDSVGALEIPLEERLTVRQYNSLSAGYFAPNLPVPIIAGVLSQTVGPANALVGFVSVAFFGNCFIMIGAAATGRYWALLMGRVLMGVAYEAIDVLPIGLMQPRFVSSWALLVGIVNGVNRLGSVCNFLLEPALYHAGGISLALLVPSLLGCSMLLGTVVIHRTDARLKRIEHEAARQVGSSCSSSSGGGGGSGSGGGSIGSSASDGSSAADSSSAADGANHASSHEPGAPAISAPLTLRALRAFSRTYWLFLLGSACVYGAVVPFWFIGAKIIAVRWRMSLSAADTFLLWPEGGIALIAPPLGMLIDRQAWTLRRRLLVCAISLSAIPLGHIALAWLPLPPIIGVLTLAAGYAFAQNLVWASIALVSPPSLLNLSSGLVGCAVNVLPALLPAAVLTGESQTDLTILAVVGLVGALAFLMAARSTSPRAPAGSRSAGLAAVVSTRDIDNTA